MENVLLKDVQSITLTRGKLTAGRRSQVPQLACTGGLCDPQYQPDTVLCRNVGSDGSRAGNVYWKCEAELANRLKFSKVDVICEGYSSPDDPQGAQDMVIGLSGNKSDLASRREVPIDEARQYASDNQCIFYEMSAKSGENVGKIFQDIARKLPKQDRNAHKQKADDDIQILQRDQQDKKGCCK